MQDEIARQNAKLGMALIENVEVERKKELELKVKKQIGLIVKIQEVYVETIKKQNLILKTIDESLLSISNGEFKISQDGIEFDCQPLNEFFYKFINKQ